MHILDSRAVSRKEVIKWWRWRSDCDSRSTPRSSSVMLVLFIHRLFSSLYLFSTCNLSAFPYHRNDHPRSMDNKQSRRSRLFPFLQWYVSYCSLIQVLTPSLFPTLISYHISNPTLSHPKKKHKQTNRRSSSITSQHHPHARRYLARYSRYHRTSYPFTRCFQPKPEPRPRIYRGAREFRGGGMGWKGVFDSYWWVWSWVFVLSWEGGGVRRMMQ